MESTVDVVFDLSSFTGEQKVRQFLEDLRNTESVASSFANGTVLLPADMAFDKEADFSHWYVTSSTERIADAIGAFELAASGRRHLLFVLDAVIPVADAVGVLAESFRIDDHFGVAIPRVADAATHEIYKVREDLGDSEQASLTRRIFCELPDYYVVPEYLGSSFLIRDLLVSNMPPLDESYSTLEGALSHYLARARRTGFRPVVINRAVFTASAGSAASPRTISHGDTRKLHTEFPDVGRAKAEFADNSLHAHESLLSRALSPRPELARSLLLDLRGVPGHVNGTAEAALGLCEALKAMDHEWNISYLAESEAIEFHRFDHRFPEWTLVPELGKKNFTAALRLSQPWHLHTLIELHHMCLLNFYAMLDTIAWDILFEAPRGIEAFWTFMAQYSDGLLYLSASTRDHVFHRFPITQSTPAYVYHHSFDPRDYAVLAPESLPREEDFFFVIGNSYDHKNLSATVDLLQSAFPFQRIKVLGLQSHFSPRVEVLESGRIPESEVDRLFAAAKLVIFPSFYEGFGLPTLKGLSYGRTVIARDSELLHEIAAHYRGPGRLLSFSHPAELVDLVGRFVHHLALEELPLGTALQPNQGPKSCRDIAAGILHFIESQLLDLSQLRWESRERAIRQLNAYCF